MDAIIPDPHLPELAAAFAVALVMIVVVISVRWFAHALLVLVAISVLVLLVSYGFRGTVYVVADLIVQLKGVPPLLLLGVGGAITVAILISAMRGARR